MGGSKIFGGKHPPPYGGCRNFCAVGAPKNKWFWAKTSIFWRFFAEFGKISPIWGGIFGKNRKWRHFEKFPLHMGGGMFSQIFLASPIWVKKTYDLSNLSCSVSPIWGGMFSNFKNFPLHMGGDVFAKITLPHGENPRGGNVFVSPMGKIAGGDFQKSAPPPKLWGGGC